MRVEIYYKNSRPGVGPYHAGGLAGNALHSVDVLRRIGIDSEAVAVTDFVDLQAKVMASKRLTHAVIEAIWVTPAQLDALASARHRVKFVVRSHSKIGFLQVEPESVKTMRGIIALSGTRPNVRFSANNQDFALSLSKVYGPVVYLPNLYTLPEGRTSRHPRSNNGRIRVGSFGASRLLKMHPSAALAALDIVAQAPEIKGLDLFINTDSTPGGDSVRRTIRNMIDGLPWATLTEVPWQPVDEFRKTIGSMDLNFQLSATESFCHVAADSVAEGVPVVGGPAISWLPGWCQVDIDDTTAAAAHGLKALRDSTVLYDEQRRLEEFVLQAIERWLHWLDR